MKILIVGGSGLLGGAVCREFSKYHEVYYTYHTTDFPINGCAGEKLDATLSGDVYDLIRKITPDVVVNAVAVASVDACENEKEKAHKINVDAMKNITDACVETKSRIVFISSAAVFDGSKHLHEEDDERKAVNYYGETKIEGEKVAESSGLPFIIARTDMPYGWESTPKKKNIVLTLLEKMDSGEEVMEITDRIVNPTYMRNFAEVLLKLIETKRAGRYNISGRDSIARYDFALKVAEVFGKEATIVPITFSEASSTVERANVRMSNRKAEIDSGIRILGAEEGLARMLIDKGIYSGSSPISR